MEEREKEYIIGLLKDRTKELKHGINMLKEDKKKEFKKGINMLKKDCPKLREWRRDLKLIRKILKGDIRWKKN